MAFTRWRLVREHPGCLAMLLRTGNAGQNTAADHMPVLDQALAQIPNLQAQDPGPLDGAGATHDLHDHLEG